jgi:hypothetical protein
MGGSGGRGAPWGDGGCCIACGTEMLGRITPAGRGGWGWGVKGWEGRFQEG